jgi:hypothetical protein
MSAAAKRAVDNMAAGRRVEARGGKRLSRQAWQDIRQACRLAAESERVRAVDIHGVHISFSAAPFCHGYNIGGCASPAWQAPAANPLPVQERPPRPPNSRQRRSAKRLEKFLHGKKAAAEAALAAEAAPTSAAGRSDTKGPASIESMDVEAPASPRREQRRILDEASEALAERSRVVAHQRPPESETRPVCRFRKPRF